jgi:hypothetical protein
MFNKQTLTAISNTLLFMFGTIIGALIGHTEMNSLLDHKHIIVIFIASGMFFLTNYVPYLFRRFRK